MDRKGAIGQIMVIMKEWKPTCTAFFINPWKIFSEIVDDVVPSPRESAIFHEAWREA